MLYIRQLEQGDFETASSLIKQAFGDEAEKACYDLIPENTMIFLDGNTPVGLCSYKTPMDDLASGNFAHTAFIDLLYLTDAAKTFSYTDGLLRAMLNLMEKRAILCAYVPAYDAEEMSYGVTASRLSKVGLDPLLDDEEVKQLLKNYRAYNYGGAQNLFKADLTEFFGRPCRSEQNAKTYS